jgi:hypothetical protein
MHPLLNRRRFESDLAGLSPELCLERGWKVMSRECPVLDLAFTAPGRPILRTRWECSGWNAVPPAIELLEEDGGPLGRKILTPKNIFHDGPHPVTGKRFICMIGSREYHTHESHLEVDWDAVRRQANYRLLDIVTQVWNGWSQATQ